MIDRFTIDFRPSINRTSYVSHDVSRDIAKALMNIALVSLAAFAVSAAATLGFRLFY